MAVTKVIGKIQFSAPSEMGDKLFSAPNGTWAPNTDVYRTIEGLVVKLELAGVSRENVEINISGNRLRIAGERLDICRNKHCEFKEMQISYGPFEKVLDVPSGYDLSQATAIYCNGFLRIDVPAATGQSVKSLQIPIH